jgi:tRNA G46 methylase TrmB
MYKQYIGADGTLAKAVQRLSDNAYIPFAPDNTDYAQFKKAISEETAQLQDAEGTLMTAQAAKDFIKELP